MHRCTIASAADIVGKRWTLPLLLELHKGHTVRFSALKRRLTITQRMLSMRLKELEAEGMLFRSVDESVVPHACSYSLTSRGKAFIPVIKHLKRWALQRYRDDTHCGRTACERCAF